ncbi:MAG: tRNA (cytidine(34)-2'-O)-methyltransferase [Elusimicrobia bacterium]|nr:tRNA (cytidine(34)-2'-O)-methyltransferase [Elusimicrobiota bacterium]
MQIVLVEPEIHWNTGNVGRTCVGTGTPLHLVEPLGFSLDAREVRRSGLDYWEKVDLRVHRDWAAFEASLAPGAPLLFFSAEAPRTFWEAPFERASYLVFGKESVGLPADLRARHADRLYRIPHGDGIRSLNLSTAAAVALYEGLRRTGWRTI